MGDFEGHVLLRNMYGGFWGGTRESISQTTFLYHIPAKSLPQSFKNTRETAQAINGWKLSRAISFLENVQLHKEAVPMRRYAGGTGRAAQGTKNNAGLS